MKYQENQVLNSIDASEWMLALIERPTDEQLKQAFASWYDQSPEHAQDWYEVVRTYEMMGNLPPKFIGANGEYVGDKGTVRGKLTLTAID
jgi:ferric-dicitrate binding protein FerR (iron transport regulator)